MAQIEPHSTILLLTAAYTGRTGEAGTKQINLFNFCHQFRIDMSLVMPGIWLKSQSYCSMFCPANLMLNQGCVLSLATCTVLEGTPCLSVCRYQQLIASYNKDVTSLSTAHITLPQRRHLSPVIGTQRAGGLWTGESSWLQATVISLTETLTPTN